MTIHYSNDLDVLSDRTIEYWGASAQTDMVIEEASELIKALCKWKRYGGVEHEGKILDEIADMYVVLNTLKRIMKVPHEDMELYIAAKVSRTNQRLDEEDDVIEDMHY